MVYIHSGPKDESDELGIMTEDVNCDVLHFQELANKAKAALDSAKFSMLLACSPQYIVYDGVWKSCKENPNQFKEDLRYLFTLLGRGHLKPNISECIGLEDMAGVQDRIELLGKPGTIVCLPTALYEKKTFVDHESSPKKGLDAHGFPLLENASNRINIHDDEVENTYAFDAGYIKPASPAHDILSDFHHMRDVGRNAPAADEQSKVQALKPKIPETTIFSSSPSNQRGGSLAPPPHSQSYSIGANEASSYMSSVGYNSVTNFSPGQTALSVGALSAMRPVLGEDPPTSIEFRSRQARKRNAFQRQKRAKERLNKSIQQNKDASNASRVEDKFNGDLPSLTQEKHAMSPRVSTRKLRREARMRGQNGVTLGTEESAPGPMSTEESILEREGTMLKSKSLHGSTGGVSAERAKSTHQVKGVRRGSQASIDKDRSIVTDNDSFTATDNAFKGMAESKGLQSKDTHTNQGETLNKKGSTPVTSNIDAMIAVQSAARSWARKKGNVGTHTLGGISETNTIHTSDRKRYPISAVDLSQKVRPSADPASVAERSALARKMSQRPNADQRPNTSNRPQVAQVDSRNEAGSAREFSSDKTSFNTLMNKWKHIDGMNRQAPA